MLLPGSEALGLFKSRLVDGIKPTKWHILLATPFFRNSY